MQNNNTTSYPAAAMLQTIPQMDNTTTQQQQQLPPQPTQINAANQLAQQQILQAFWNNQLIQVEQQEPDFKTHALPIARIKKVMKTDDEVKSLMISAEAPVVFAKACEIFIEELTLRAWMHAEESKRRTLQKSDIASAVAKSDMYDFLIDIVPRDLDMMKVGGMKKPEEFYASAQQDQTYSYTYNPQFAAAAQAQEGYMKNNTPQYADYNFNYTNNPTANAAVAAAQANREFNSSAAQRDLQ